KTKARRNFFLARGIRLESNRREEGLIDKVRSKSDLLRRNQIAFPEFKGPTAHRGLISDRAQNETAIRLEVIVLEKLLSSLERKISTINKILVKFIKLSVDVINSVAVLSIDREQNMRQSVGRIGIVNDCQRVKLCPRVKGR